MALVAFFVGLGLLGVPAEGGCGGELDDGLSTVEQPLTPDAGEAGVEQVAYITRVLPDGGVGCEEEALVPVR